MSIKIIAADITKLRVTAIVNAAKNSLLGGGGVDGAIHRAAGPELLEECERLNGCATGNIRVTGAYNLPADYVIHTVGPVYVDGKSGEEQALDGCYFNALSYAVACGFKSISFPSISTGVYGYPLEDATRVALKVALEFENEIEIYFTCFPAENVAVYNKILSQLRKEKNQQ